MLLNICHAGFCFLGTMSAFLELFWIPSDSNACMEQLMKAPSNCPLQESASREYYDYSTCRVDPKVCPLLLQGLRTCVSLTLTSNLVAGISMVVASLWESSTAALLLLGSTFCHCVLTMGLTAIKCHVPELFPDNMEFLFGGEDPNNRNNNEQKQFNYMVQSIYILVLCTVFSMHAYGMKRDLDRGRGKKDDKEEDKEKVNLKVKMLMLEGGQKPLVENCTSGGTNKSLKKRKRKKKNAPVICPGQADARAGGDMDDIPPCYYSG